MSTLRVALMVWAMIAGCSSSAMAQPSGRSTELQVAAKHFNALPLAIRHEVQMLLIVGGYSDSVTNDEFSRRLFASIHAFQTQHGFFANGIMDARQHAQLKEVADPLLSAWGLKLFKHPVSGSPLWVPAGLNLEAETTENGVLFKSPRFEVAFRYLPRATLAGVHTELESLLRSKGVAINYSLVKPDFATIISANGTIDAMRRYQRIGNGVIGFSLQWDRQVHPDAIRLAVLMSDLFRANVQLNLARMPPRPLTPAVATSTPPPPKAQAASRSEPPKDGPNEDTVSTGTGFYVSQSGHILTNNHVIEGCRSVTVTTHDGGVQRARIIGSDQVNDLALVQVAEKPPAVASIRTGARIGEPAFAFGFPLAGVLATSGNFTSGSITATAGLLDDTRMYQVSTPVQAGNSGGPLLDQTGNVVGVIVSKLDVLKVAAVLKDMPQNINFAIKANVAVGFLEAKGVTAASSSSNETVAPADIAEWAKRFSVYIVCK